VTAEGAWRGVSAGVISGCGAATVLVVARNPRRIAFESATDMGRHLNGWSATSLTAPEQWADALVASRQWLDYSARNQVLLASYGVDGPVAGQETWRLVPSTTDGRPCAVRAGEHGWPVRVPITTGGSEPDPYLGGARPSRARTERFEWRPVFAIDQLARRPAPGALLPVEVPKRLTGRRAAEAYFDSVRKVARTTVRGRLPASTDAHQVLAEAAVRLSRGAKGPPLEPVLGEQVAWLVADRVGLAPGGLPAFDPEALEPRDRWQRLQAVLDPARKLTAALGVVVGADLTASPLPKMEIVDDRVVPAGRRRRLPAASFERLPIGSWVEVGPYSPDEWAGRGESGSGRGAYLRLNRSAYVVAVENGTEAAWRLEDIAERTGHDLLAAGDSPSLDQAKGDAVAALAGRYPALDTPTAAIRTDPGRGEPAALPQAPGEWEPAAGEGTSAAVQRRLDDRVVVYAFPGPGGRWLPAVHNGTRLTHLAYAPNQDAAKAAAELAGRRSLRHLASQSPVNRDATIAAFALSQDYSRAELVDLAGDALHAEAREQLADQHATPETIADVLHAAGCTPATAVQVLRAEQVDAGEVARLLPTIGVPMDHAIRLLHDGWGVPRHQAAKTLGATAAEMRAAGCTPAEVMATRPRDVLRTLPTDPEIWAAAALTMVDGGHHTPAIVSHLVAHAPTTDAFAHALSAVAEDPAEGITTAIRYGAQPDHLAAAAEAYSLTPVQAATLLTDAGATAQVTVETVHALCDHDLDLTAQVAGPTLNLDPRHVTDLLDTTGAAMPTIESPDPTDTNSLLAHLPDPEPATDLNSDSLLALLPQPDALDAQPQTPEATP
jgi:hypothetical protein